MKEEDRRRQKGIFWAAFFLLLFWQLWHVFLGRAILPSPTATLTRLLTLFPEPLLPHLLASLWRMTAAISLSLLLGLPLGAWMALSVRTEHGLSPLLNLLYPIPKIAFLPILMLALGLGDASKIALMMLVIIFQFIYAAESGIRSINKAQWLSIRSLHLPARAILRHLLWPAALPHILTAMRHSLGISFALLFTAENFATSYGLGYFIMNSWLMVNYTDMFAGIFLMSACGFLLYQGIYLLERRLCPYRFIYTEMVRQRW